MKSADTENNNGQCGKYSINDLPDEVIEFVLSFVPPYKDLHDCMLVCKRWRTNVLNVVRIKRRQLQASLATFKIQWQVVRPADKTPSITRRYSHSAVVHGNSMYVFGGCTNSMTTFNDLWRLDLSTRQWVRPLALGIYPTPKACSSMVSYKDSLVVFGGWAYPSTFPFHQTYQLFNELHLYNVASNKWHFVSTNNPPPMAGHSVSVHGEWMILFGGMQRCHVTGNTVRTNDVWKMHLETLVWHKQATAGRKPSERYGHSQTVLDDQHLLIMGGCGGPNDLFNDVWLLTMAGDAWQWSQLPVRGKQWAPADTWCHPACRVGNYVVVFNKSRSHLDHIYYAKTCWRPPGHELPQQLRSQPPRQVDRDVNVNGRRGTFHTRRPEPQAGASTSRPPPPPCPDELKGRDCAGHRQQHAGSLALAAFTTKCAGAGKNRERQLELLRKMEDFLKSRGRHPLDPPQAKHKHKRSALELYLLDIAHALDDQPYVSWVAPNEGGARGTGPDDTLLYTLVQGKGELIMFGGIQKDNATAPPPPLNVLSADFDPCSCATKVSNSLHFICAPRDVI